MADPYDMTVTIPALGMWAQPYATAYPELVGQLDDLYHSRADLINWLPWGWMGSVDALHGHNGYIMVPAPASAPNAPGLIKIPWLDTPDKVAWWNDFAKRGTALVEAMGRKDLAAGQNIIAQANNDANFWNTAYSIASTLALPITAPVQAVRKIAGNVVNYAETQAAKNPWLTATVAGSAMLTILYLLMRKKRK